jgi:ribosome-binding factor A
VVSQTRLDRINERMREELSEILLQEVADPRLVGVSITDVKVDRELTVADIYFSSLEGSERVDEIQSGFTHAQGFLRKALADRVDLRIFPRLRFHYDPTFERAQRIEELFAILQTEAQEIDTEDADVESETAENNLLDEGPE